MARREKTPPAAPSAAPLGTPLAAPPAAPSAAPLVQRWLSAFIAVVLLSVALPGQVAFGEQENENLVDPTQRADNSFIRDTNIESLAEQGAFFNDREVQVLGEVIGDCIAASDPGYSWITLTVTDVEDKTSISVLISDEQAAQIDRYGKYGVTGTTLQVNGIFHQACNVHDGLPDIHVSGSSVISRGEDHYDTFNGMDFIPGIVAVAAGFALMAAFYFARERTR